MFHGKLRYLILGDRLNDLVVYQKAIDVLYFFCLCIDESTNTFQYLYALQKRGLFKWHEVAGKKRRIVWLFTHWSALIRDTTENQLYVVDSWYLDNGEPPYIQKLEDWEDKKSFPVALNP